MELWLASRVKQVDEGAAIVNRFERMCSDLAVEDLGLLLNIEGLYNKIYVFDRASKSVFHPGLQDVPWPVVWLLCRHHKRHAFCSKLSLRIHTILEDVLNFENKCKWRWVHRHSHGSKPSIWIRSRSTAPCKQLVDPALIAWLHRFRSTIIKAARRARATSTRSNISAIDRLGMLLLRRSGAKAVPTDKDGGFALLPRHAFMDAQSEMLSQSMYEEVGMHELSSVRVHGLYAQARKLAWRIERFNKEPDLAAAINKSMSVPGASLCANLQLTVKTHKPAGDVGFRNIHASPGYAFAGLASWLSRVCLFRLRGCEHLIRDSGILCGMLAQRTFDEGMHFVKLDIKEFYMSGVHSQLINVVSSAFTGALRALLTDTLWLVMGSQFVTASEHPQRAWRVLEGSGMGLRHSGDVADLAFWVQCERDYACVPAMQLYHEISLYVRFKDDILIIGSCREKTRKFIHAIIQRSTLFKLVCDEINSHEIHFLDVRIFRSGRRFGTEMAFKPTNLGIPLSTQSAHPVHVHVSWPVARIRSIARLSSSRCVAEKAKQILISRFTAFGTPQCIIDKIVATDPWGSPRRQQRCDNSDVLWFPVRFHPGWCQHVQRAIGMFCRDKDAKLLWQYAFGKEMPAMRPAWYNGLPQLSALTRKL